MGTVPEDGANRKLSYFTAECVVQGIVGVTAVFFANDNPFGGATSAFHVVGENTTFIVFTLGTDMQADDYCVFSWTGGWEPPAPYNGTFAALVFVTPNH